MSMTIQSGVKDKILAAPSEMSKVENAPAEMLCDLDQQMEKRADDGCTLWIKLYSKYEYEIRYHPGRENVVINTLRRKERVKPRRVRATAMTLQYGVRGMILAAQSEEFKQENVLAEMLHGLDPQMERKGTRIEMDDLPRGFGRRCRRLPVLWVEIGESSLTGLELVQETTNKVVLVKGKALSGDALEGRNAFWKEGLHVPLDEIKVDKTLCFVEEPVENSDRKVKRLKCSRMVVVKFLFDELRYRVVNDVVMQLKVLMSLLDDGQGLGSWMYLFVWSGYAAMGTLLWAGKVLSCSESLDSRTSASKVFKAGKSFKCRLSRKVAEALGPFFLDVANSLILEYEHVAIELNTAGTG
ncbi:hypothetical protein Tco_1245124 [Tanacetum coccineum]